MPKDCKYVIG